MYFLTEYLQRTGADDQLSRKQPLILGSRLFDIIDNGPERLSVTPLLMRLLVEEARSLVEHGCDLDQLSDSVPKLMVEYVYRTNPPDPQTPKYVPNSVLIRAARVLGRVSLGEAYVPGDFDLRAGTEAIETTHDIDAPSLVIERLLDNGILECREVGGTRFLRFLLDSLAEYLTAIELLDAFRQDIDKWTAWLQGKASPWPVWASA